ncbi:MAG TPA: fumarylacetoacetate hydrolase family protein [Myxococcaceae bacterium]|jgi:2-oxo-3-hexenedioate decarboxylase|nr:fumarylacetoacetate hydrolase family protein [Myxococcaceae bacterium]
MTLDFDALARRLDDARLGGREVERLTLEAPDLTLEQAYRIMDGGVALRSRRGERVVGLKMGLTSEAKRRQMGLGAPIYGVLTDAMQVREAFRMKGSLHPKIEPEIAFHFRNGLRGRPGRGEVLAACTGVCAALEILDSRYRDFKYFSLPDVVADNASSSHFALGRWTEAAGLSLGDLELVMSVDGEPRQRAPATAISGDPVLSVVQLCELLDRRGLSLPPESFVLAGAATVAEPLGAGQTVELRAGELPPVTVRVES